MNPGSWLISGTKPSLTRRPASPGLVTPSYRRTVAYITSLLQSVGITTSGRCRGHFHVGRSLCGLGNRGLPRSHCEDPRAASAHDDARNAAANIVATSAPACRGAPQLLLEDQCCPYPQRWGSNERARQAIAVIARPVVPESVAIRLCPSRGGGAGVGFCLSPNLPRMRRVVAKVQ